MLCSLGYAEKAEAAKGGEGSASGFWVVDCAVIPGVLRLVIAEADKGRLQVALRKLHQLRSVLTVLSFVHLTGPDYPMDSADEIDSFTREMQGDGIFEKLMKAAFLWNVSRADDTEAVCDVAAADFKDNIRSKVLFRCTGLRVGKGYRKDKPRWKSPDAERVMGGVIHDYTNWTASMQLFNLQVVLVIAADRLLVGIPLCGENQRRIGHDFSNHSREVRRAQDMSYLQARGSERLLIKQATDAKAEDLRRRLLAGETYASLKDEFKEIEGSLKLAGTKNEVRIAKSENSMHVPIAHGLLVLSDVRPGDVVLDPMAGSGTTLLEASLVQPLVGAVLGGDLQANECSVAALNVESYLKMADSCGLTDDSPPLAATASTPDAKRPRIEGEAPLTVNTEWRRRTPAPTTVFHWSATQLPLRDASVDVVVTDMPFGNRCKSPVKMMSRMLTELARVVRPGGRVTLLLMQNKHLDRFLSEVCALFLFSCCTPDQNTHTGTPPDAVHPAQTTLPCQHG